MAVPGISTGGGGFSNKTATTSGATSGGVTFAPFPPLGKGVTRDSGFTSSSPLLLIAVLALGAAGLILKKGKK